MSINKSRYYGKSIKLAYGEISNGNYSNSSSLALMKPPPAFPTLNSKYKTEECRDFKFLGKCDRGSKCHFAHGPKEIRNPDEPLPKKYHQ